MALAAPFTLGNAQRALARREVFLKSAQVVEKLARVDQVVFDKTGTLSTAGAEAVNFEGEPLSEVEQRGVYSLAQQSTHPAAVQIARATGDREAELVRSFAQVDGCGIEGNVAGRRIWMGSTYWLQSRAVVVPAAQRRNGSEVHLAVEGRYRGCFVLTGALRAQTGRMLRELSATCPIALLSGDNDRERPRFTELFGIAAPLHFNQTPLDKLQFVRQAQQAGRTVMMVGDGLNDAGALRQSDVGVAVVESIHAFSPASDVIMAAGMVPRIPALLRFARESTRVVRASFFISSLYNVVGITIAAQGLLSPVICAILMPLSSITVVAFACAATNWRARRLGRVEEQSAPGETFNIQNSKFKIQRPTESVPVLDIAGPRLSQSAEMEGPFSNNHVAAPEGGRTPQAEVVA